MISFPQGRAARNKKLTPAYETQRSSTDAPAIRRDSSGCRHEPAPRVLRTLYFRRNNRPDAGRHDREPGAPPAGPSSNAPSARYCDSQTFPFQSPDFTLAFITIPFLHDSVKTATYHFLRHLLFSMNRLNRSCFLIKNIVARVLGKAADCPQNILAYLYFSRRKCPASRRQGARVNISC